METNSANTSPRCKEFHNGDAVVLAEGTYQGTRGVFLRLKDDVQWADITEPSGRIRSHPVIWLDKVQQTGAASLASR